MQIQVSWDSEAHLILRVDFEPTWDWKDWGTAKQQIDSMIASSPNDHFYTLLNAPSTVTLPPNFLSKSSNMAFRKNPRVRRSYVVAPNTFARVLLGTLTKISPAAAQNIKVVASLDEAYARIAAEEAHLLQQSG